MASGTIPKPTSIFYKSVDYEHLSNNNSNEYFVQLSNSAIGDINDNASRIVSLMIEQFNIPSTISVSVGYNIPYVTFPEGTIFSDKHVQILYGYTK